MHGHRSSLKQIDDEKRATLRKLAAGAAFAAPVVLSFSLGSFAITDARAYVGASTEPGDRIKLPASGDTATGRSGRTPVKPLGQN